MADEIAKHEHEIATRRHLIWEAVLVVMGNADVMLGEFIGDEFIKALRTADETGLESFRGARQEGDGGIVHLPLLARAEGRIDQSMLAW